MKKNLCLYTALFLMSLVFFSCKKGDTGPAGPAGPAGSQGPQGPQGIQGNANATQYTFGTQDFAASTFRSFGITTTQDTVNNSTWLVYLYATNSRWYFIPGYGFGGATQYRVSLAYESNKAVVYVDKSGAGESYSKARVIRIYNNTNITVTGNSHYPDLNDYQAVSAYYHLSD